MYVFVLSVENFVIIDPDDCEGVDLNGDGEISGENEEGLCVSSDINLTIFDPTP